MNIWLVNPYGNLPGEGWRAYRETLLGEALAEQGYEVMWWVSNFEHRGKTFRSKSWKEITVSERFIIRCVPSTPYASHISFARIQYEQRFAHNFRRRALDDKVFPDVIVLTEPAPFTSGIVMDVVRAAQSRLIVDIVDLWPEIFTIALPRWLRPFSRGIFAPIYWRRRWLFNKADAFMASASDYLALVERYSPGRPGVVVYLGIDLKEFDSGLALQRGAAISTLPSKGANEIWAIYAGTLGNNYDFRAILDCAQKIKSSGLPIRIVIAGDGPLRNYVERRIREERLDNVSYAGSLGVDSLRCLYENCDIALSCYVANSTVSMPVKAFDYLAAGLPIVNSLGKDLGKLIVQEKIGLQYRAEDEGELFQVIRKLAQDDVLRQSTRSNALNVVKQFDTRIQYKKVQQLIENLRIISKSR